MFNRFYDYETEKPFVIHRYAIVVLTHVQRL